MPDAAPITATATLVDANGVRVAEFAMAPRAEGPWHRHSHVTEHCYALAGAIVVECAGRLPAALAVGERCTLPAGVVHRVRNAGDAAARYLVVQGVGAYDFVSSPAPDDGAD